MVRMVELDPVPIDQPDGRVGPECRDRELLQEISPDLQICVLLLICLACPRSCGFLLANAGTPRSRLVMRLRRLPDGFRQLIRRPLLGSSEFRC